MTLVRAGSRLVSGWFQKKPRRAWTASPGSDATSLGLPGGRRVADEAAATGVERRRDAPGHGIVAAVLAALSDDGGVGGIVEKGAVAGGRREAHRRGRGQAESRGGQQKGREETPAEGLGTDQAIHAFRLLLSSADQKHPLIAISLPES